MRERIAHQAHAQGARLLCGILIGHRRGIHYRVGPPRVQVIRERATTVGVVPGVGGDLSRRGNAKAIALHQVFGVTDRGLFAERVRVLDPHAFGHRHEARALQVRVIGHILPEHRIGAEDECGDVGLAGSIGGQREHVIQLDIALAVGIGTHIPLRKIDRGDLHIVGVSRQLIEQVAEVRYLLHVPVGRGRIFTRARNRRDIEQRLAAGQHVGEVHAGNGSIRTRVPVAQAFDARQAVHVVERIA